MTSARASVKICRAMFVIFPCVIFSYLPPATKLGQGYVFTGVCDSVHRMGGVPDQVHPLPWTRYTPPDQAHPPWDQVHPLDQAPPQTRTPPGPGTPPPAQSMLGDTVNARAVRILLECILVRIYIANYQKL